MAGLLIKGGTIVNYNEIVNSDILIVDEKILAIGEKLEKIAPNDLQIIDATGKYIFPGAIDPHVQVEGKYKNTEMTDDFYTAGIAAACGGMTTIIDFAVQPQDNASALETLAKRRAVADAKVCTDYCLQVGITDPRDDVIAEIDRIVNQQGVACFKCYMTYRSRGRLVEEPQLLKVMTEVAKHNGVVQVHAENNNLVEYLTDQLVNAGKTSNKDFPLSRPKYVEEIAVATTILLAKATGCAAYIKHVSSGGTVELIDEARNRGLEIYGETCPQYLMLNEDVYQQDDGILFVMNPPIRDEASRLALWDGLNNDCLHTIGTDHCSYTIEQKMPHSNSFTTVPAGVPGLETMLPIMYSHGVAKGKISLQEMVALTSTNTAKIFGLYPQKGLIAPGSDGDIAILDPNVQWEIKASELHQPTDFNPYEGLAMTGKVITTVLRGSVIYTDGKFTGEKGFGKFIYGKRG